MRERAQLQAALRAASERQAGWDAAMAAGEAGVQRLRADHAAALGDLQRRLEEAQAGAAKEQRAREQARPAAAAASPRRCRRSRPRPPLSR